MSKKALFKLGIELILPQKQQHNFEHVADVSPSQDRRPKCHPYMIHIPSIYHHTDIQKIMDYAIDQFLEYNQSIAKTIVYKQVYKWLSQVLNVVFHLSPSQIKIKL